MLGTVIAYAVAAILGLSALGLTAYGAWRTILLILGLADDLDRTHPLALHSVGWLATLVVIGAPWVL